MHRDGVLVLCAGSVLAFVLGSVHAFSVFLEPLEARFSASRADVSFCYSLALVSITAAVSFGYRLYQTCAAWILALLIGSVSVLGIGLAWSAQSLEMVWIGYGLVFGFANGLGYGFSLQISAQLNPGREGLAMGLITAAYALGATSFPIWFVGAVDTGGFPKAMEVLGLSVLCAAIVAAALMAYARARFVGGTRSSAPIDGRGTFALWLAYGTAVAAGLMASGHATGIAAARGVGTEMLVAAPIALALCNMIGSLGGGALTDRVSSKLLMMTLPLVSAVALGLLAADLMPSVLTGLGLIGLIYGAIISVYPAVIARRYGVADGVRIYAWVFSAWAAAGLGGPWVAGMLFDRTGDYALALWIAAVLGLLSASIALTMRLNPPKST